MFSILTSIPETVCPLVNVLLDLLIVTLQSTWVWYTTTLQCMRFDILLAFFHAYIYAYVCISAYISIISYIVYVHTCIHVHEWSAKVCSCMGIFTAYMSTSACVQVQLYVYIHVHMYIHEYMYIFIFSEYVFIVYILWICIYPYTCYYIKVSIIPSYVNFHTFMSKRSLPTVYLYYAHNILPEIMLFPVQILNIEESLKFEVWLFESHWIPYRWWPDPIKYRT